MGHHQAIGPNRATGPDPDAAASAAAVERRLARLRSLGWLLDDRFGVPGTRWRFGLDGLLGLVPVIGDAGTAVLAAYIVFEARRLGVPKRVVARMLLNLGLDLTVGAVPLIGDLFDFGWKANRRNIALLNRHFDRQRPAAGPE